MAIQYTKGDGLTYQLDVDFVKYIVDPDTNSVIRATETVSGAARGTTLRLRVTTSVLQGDILSAAYAHIKTLPAYAGAVDV